MSHWAEHHWLLFSEKTNLVTGCHCGFKADTEIDCGYGDTVVRHIVNVALEEAHPDDGLAEWERKLLAREKGVDVISAWGESAPLGCTCGCAADGAPHPVETPGCIYTSDEDHPTTTGDTPNVL